MTEIRTQFLGDDDYSQSACFICAKQLSPQNGQNHQTCDREYSIRTLFRYLKINQVIQINSSANQPVDFVRFCERCYSIFETLSNYCADLEVLQMRICYFSNELNKLTVVDETTENCDTINKARKQLKTKLLEKCTLKNLIGPLVLLPQLEVEQIRTVTSQTRDANFERLSDDDYEPEEYVDMIEIPDGYRHNSDVDYESETSLPSKTKSRKSKQTRPTSNSNGGDKLPTCSTKTFPCSECSYKFKCRDSLLEHSPLYHPEKHFPPETKPANFEQSQHKMYLTHLLNTEVDSCGSSKSGFICVYCSKAFKSKRKQTLRLHLVKEHQEKLLENLRKLQNDVSIEKLSIIVKKPEAQKEKANNFKLKQFCKIKKKMKPEHNCSVCQVRTTSLRKHEAIHHPEKFLLSKRLEKVSPEQFKIYCIYLISKQVENFTKFHEDRKVRFRCPFCQNTYGDLQGCRNHLVLGHVSLLLAEIENIQETVNPEELKTFQKRLNSKAKYYVRSTKKVVEINTEKCKICDVLLTRRGMTIHMKKNHPIEFSKTYNCDVCLICEQSFSDKWWLDFHKTRSHANVLFEKSKLVSTPIEQFKMYCDHVIKREVSGLREVDGINGKIRFKCSYCTRTFSEIKYNQIHMVMEHKEILGNKIEDLQKNKTVREIEQELVSGSEKSGERFEVGDEFEATEVFCDKSVLKLEANEDWDENDDEMVDLDELNEKRLEEPGIEIKQEDCRMDEEGILPN